MISEKDHNELAVYTNLLFKNGWYLFLRFDIDGKLIMLLMDSMTGDANIEHMYSVKQLEEWICKTKISKKYDI